MTDQPIPTTNQQPQAPDYGEPWDCSMDHEGRIIITKAEGKILCGWANRAKICVNACAGIPNETLTKEYIQEAIAALNTIKKINASDCERCGAKQPFKMQCKECGSSVGCGVSGEDIDNE